MALQNPRTARLIGLSDQELAEALGIPLERLVDALNEAGLGRSPGYDGTLQEEPDRARYAAAALLAPRVAVMRPSFAQERGFHLGFRVGLS